MSNREFRGQDPDAFGEWLKPFFPECRVFHSSGGRKLVVFEAFPPGQRADGPYLRNGLFLSENSGVRFLQLHELGSSRGGAARYTCEDRDGTRVTFLVDNDVATLLRAKDDNPTGEWEHFRLVSNVERILSEAVFVPLPEVRVPEYLFVHPEGRAFYVDALKYGYSYDTFRCFTGPRGALARAAITDVSRYRDGGSTFVHTDLGILFSPAQMGDADKRAYWLPSGTDLTPFDRGRPVGQLPGAVEIQQVHCRMDAAQALAWLLPA